MQVVALEGMDSILLHFELLGSILDFILLVQRKQYTLIASIVLMHNCTISHSFTDAGLSPNVLINKVSLPTVASMWLEINNCGLPNLSLRISMAVS